MPAYVIRSQWTALFTQHFGQKRAYKECMRSNARSANTSRQVGEGLDKPQACEIQACEITSCTEHSFSPETPVISTIQPWDIDIKPNMPHIVLGDRHLWNRYDHDMQLQVERMDELINPVQVWKVAMTEDLTASEDVEALLGRSRLSRNADEKICLDDEGAIDVVELDRQQERIALVDSRRRAERHHILAVSKGYNIAILNRSNKDLDIRSVPRNQYRMRTRG